MALALLPVQIAIVQGNGTTFEAVGGTAPYTYSVLPGGIGGTINPGTGAYTPPANAIGFDTIQVIDNTLATATATILVGTVLHILGDIIQTELGLANDHCYLWDQKINEPKDQSLFVAIHVLSCKPFSNTIEYLDNGGGGQSEVQRTNFYANIQLDIISRSQEAVFRKEEVVMALKSVYAQQQQELNSFYIATIPNSFTNLSGLDGTAIPYRFQINVGIQYLVKKVKAIDYYDTFEQPSLTINLQGDT